MNNYQMTFTKNRAFLVWGMALLGTLACRSCVPVPMPGEVPTPQPTIDLDELRFSDHGTGERFHNLEACLQEFVDESWRPPAYHLSANYYELRWCRGVGTQPECQNMDPSKDRRDQHIIELFTKFYNLPEVFGLGIRALWVPETTGWKAFFSFFEGSDRADGDGWGVTLGLYTSTTGRPEAYLELGDTYSYKAVETVITYTPEVPIREDLADFLAGPEAMRDRALTQIRALAQAVREEVDAGQVSGCDYPPYEGHGIPPICTPHPMTAAEKAEQITRAEPYFADQERLLQDHYQEMYAAWMKAFPFDHCPP